jgi:hypothetical protein
MSHLALYLAGRHVPAGFFAGIRTGRQVVACNE